MKGPRVLISGQRGDRSTYEKAVALSGGEGVSRYLPPPDSGGYDGLLLCGGGDLDGRYFDAPNPAPAGVDLARDRAELAAAAAFLADRKPILGVCRGFQLLNVLLGGTLIQHLPPERLARHAWAEGDRLHRADCFPGSLMEELCGRTVLVNSAHHQAVERLAPCLRPTQWAEDGVIEAFEHPWAPLWGVQWHPERMPAGPGLADGLALIRRFVSRCGTGG